MTKSIFKGSIKSKLLPIVSVLLIAGVLGSVVAIFSRDRAPDEESSLESSYGGGFIGDDWQYTGSYINAEGVLTYDSGSRAFETTNIYKKYFGQGINDTWYDFPSYGGGDYRLRINSNRLSYLSFLPLTSEGFGVFETDIVFESVGQYFTSDRWAIKLIVDGTKGDSVPIFWENHHGSGYYGVGIDFNDRNEYKMQLGREYSLKVLTTDEGYAVYMDGICIYQNAKNIGSIVNVKFEFRSQSYVKNVVVEFDNTYCNNIVAE